MKNMGYKTKSASSTSWMKWKWKWKWKWKEELIDTYMMSIQSKSGDPSYLLNLGKYYLDAAQTLLPTSLRLLLHPNPSQSHSTCGYVLHLHTSHLPVLEIYKDVSLSLM